MNATSKQWVLLDICRGLKISYTCEVRNRGNGSKEAERVREREKEILDRGCGMVVVSFTYKLPA